MKSSNTVSIHTPKMYRYFYGNCREITKGKQSFFCFKNLVKFYFSVLGENNLLKFLGDEVWPTINVIIHACNSAIPMEDHALSKGCTPAAIIGQ